MHTKLPIISFFQKLIIFLLPDFQRIREEVSKSGILWSIPWVDVIKRFIWFFKNYTPRGTKAFYSNGSKVKGSIHRDEFITNNDHQFFQESHYSKTWKQFSFYYHFFFCFFMFALEFISLFKSIRVIQSDKTWNKSPFILCKCLMLKWCLHLSRKCI